MAKLNLYQTLKYLSYATTGGLGVIVISKFYLRRHFEAYGYYKKTIKITGENAVVKKLLGEPIEFGKLDLGDVANFFATPEKAFFSIGVWGPSDSGALTSYCERSPNGVRTETEDSGEEADDGWEVMRIELRVKKLKDKRLIVFRRPEADLEYVNTFRDSVHQLQK
ncbi:uncharacterized protein LOC100901638 [Galendromus occidentalis]|uniref:Uncharacterized protein LOC100901638 n=1 Tax=Galendromus occidentalis TaxID=34638 RepID=A0AAJ6QUF8_9ACAR|nr:uncharacterized protein LOC100901638 [Galendromus occidentalis]